jgi:hypothetical protein
MWSYDLFYRRGTKGGGPIFLRLYSNLWLSPSLLRGEWKAPNTELEAFVKQGRLCKWRFSTFGR